MANLATPNDCDIAPYSLQTQGKNDVKITGRFSKGIMALVALGCDLTARQLAALSIAAADANGVTVRAVALQLRIPKPTVSRIADRLAEDGLLRRAEDARDGRSVLLIATRAGLNLLRTAEA